MSTVRRISQEDLRPQADDGDDARAAAISRGARLLYDPVPDRLTYGWETNFEVHSVPYSEIVSGGPPRDGIPPIDSPVFFVASSAPDYMRAEEPVIALEIAGAAKAYPRGHADPSRDRKRRPGRCFPSRSPTALYATRRWSSIAGWEIACSILAPPEERSCHVGPADTVMVAADHR